MADRSEMQQSSRQIEGLLNEVEAIADEKTRSNMLQLIQLLMNMHAACLERVMEILSEAGPPGHAVIEKLGGDEVVASLLLLYGLHPVPFETRVLRALDKVRPYLHSHGGDVELAGIEDGVVRLRLQGSCHGCSSSMLTLKSVIEEAIVEAAPDVSAIEVTDAAPAPAPGFVPLNAVRPRPERAPGIDELKVIV